MTSQETTNGPEEKAHSEPATMTNATPTPAEPIYPTGRALLGRMSAIYMTIFLISLDRTIMATAIPRITDEFHSIKDIGWYGSSYLLPLCCFQLLFGRLYALYDSKWVFFGCLFIFEIGSAVCGSAPQSIALILGRTIAGIGAGGIYSGGITILIQSTPLEKRPIYQAGIGALAGICLVIGPLVGGALTDGATWRWCFYLNLPIGGIAAVILLFVLKSNNTPRKKRTFTETVKRLDPIGTILLMSTMICLLLAIQWGGTTYAWGSARIIILLVFFGVLLTIWLIQQVKMADTAILPPRISTQRSVAFATFYSLCMGGAMITLTYYISVWFQAIKGVSALNSGIRTIPWVVSQVLASLFTGRVVQTFGYYSPFLIAGAVFISIGSGLMTTFTPSTGHAKWIGFEVIFGLGLGFGFQQPSLTVQNVLKGADVPVGISLVLLALTLGGAVFLAVGESIFTNQLAKNLEQLQGVNASTIINGGAAQIRDLVPTEQLDSVILAYNGAVINTFRVVLALSCATIIGAFGVEWKRIEKSKPKSPKASEPVKESKAEGQNMNQGTEQV